jgi:hypothetical protein
MFHINESGVEPGQADYLYYLGVGKTDVTAQGQSAFAHRFFYPVLSHNTLLTTLAAKTWRH